MQVQVTLHGMFRQKLAPELRGKTGLELLPEATLADVLVRFEITQGVICSVNGQIQPDKNQTLHEGDQIQLFQPLRGG